MTSLVVTLVPDLAKDTTLCGRPAIDWLLDTVQALAPTHIAYGDDETPAGDVRLTIPCSLALVRVDTLRAAVEAAAAHGRSVVLQPVRDTPWWAEQAREAAPAITASPEPDAPLGQHVTLRGVEALWLADPVDRTEAENALYRRIAARWQGQGVRIEDPASTRIDATVHIGPGAILRPYTELLGTTVIGAGSRIGPTTTVRDAVIGADCVVQYAVCQDVEIGDGANVGPFTWLRSQTRLGDRCRAGAFVELADSVVEADTKMPHLTALLSADVGRNANLGSMSGPANFDGVRKHRVRIGDDASIGAGSILVAPVSIGAGASTAAGSVVTENVPDGALAISRTPQKNVDGWAALQARRARS